MCSNCKLTIKFSLLLFVSGFLFFSCSDDFSGEISVSSPDRDIEVVFNTGAKGMSYSVYFKDSLLMDKSGMGFDFANADPLEAGVEIIDAELKHIQYNWEPAWGERKVIRNEYNELFLTLREDHPEGRTFNLVFRLADDGLAFRFEFPESFASDSLIIMSENTEFRFVNDMRAWFIPANFDSYEMLYDSVPLSELNSANTPLTLESYNKDCFVSIHEANLTRYSGMTLYKDSANALCMISELVPWPDGVKVRTTLPAKTPWRTIQVSSDAAGLIESSLILNMNDPCVLENTDWIQPVKYLGVWWGMHLGTHTWTMGNRHGATTEEMLKYIEFARNNGFDAVLAEGWNTGWENWGKPGAFDQVTPYADFDLSAICDSAESYGLDFIGHHETGGDVLTYESVMDSAFRLYQSLGVNYVKTGYAGGIRPNGYYHHSQYMVEHYRRVVELAAKYQVCLDVHEPVKATGISRTYPNMMTREGARGMEWNAWSEGNPPNHHVILPFTRCLAGPLDYTPGIFDLTYDHATGRVKWNGQDKGNSRVNTTLAKQLALFVVFYSPMQMASDNISNYDKHPAFGFIKKVPVDWADTRVLDADIGESLCIVRKDKSSDDWFLGAVTNESARNIDISMDFLDTDKDYVAHIFADGDDASWNENPTSVSILEKCVHPSDSLSLKLAPGGGVAIWFESVSVKE